MAQPLITLSYTDPTESGNNDITDGTPTIVATFNSEELYNEMNSGPDGTPVYINLYLNGKFYSSQLVTSDTSQSISIQVPSGSDTVTATLSTQQGYAGSPPPYSTVLGTSNPVTFTDNGLSGVTISNVVVTTPGGTSTGDTITAGEDNSGFNVTGMLGGVNAPSVTKVTVELDRPNGAGAVDVVTATLSGSTFTATFPAGLTLPQGSGYSLVVTAQDSSGDTVSSTTIASSTVCFMAGTRIRTPRGEVPVEELRAGDLVITAGGDAEAVVWVGRQTVSRVFGDPLRILPIRISAGALGQNQPVRDLLISPDHAVKVGDYLVQASCLVNGSTITREAEIPEIFTYYHVECAGHRLVFAEGVLAETFIDNVDRLAFDNWAERPAKHNPSSMTEIALPRVKTMRMLKAATRSQQPLTAYRIGSLR